MKSQKKSNQTKLNLKPTTKLFTTCDWCYQRKMTQTKTHDEFKYQLCDGCIDYNVDSLNDDIIDVDSLV